MNKCQTGCSATPEQDKAKTPDTAASPQTEAQKKADADKAATPSAKA
ncbi:MAG: hypothetical protein PHY92_08040 [Alphaproteobacteria bacterium]|nr:hypothetical protein [Alphaproteobacteria bacterium]